jgi:hypothetical protein
MTIFSNWPMGAEPDESSSQTAPFNGLRLPLDADLDAEWFAWILEELIEERNCYLIIEKNSGDAHGYVQFAAGPKGELIAETQSNQFIEEAHHLTIDQEMRLLELGWNPPSIAAGGSRSLDCYQSPNFFRFFDERVPVGEVALLALRTLRDIYGTIAIGNYRFVFFRKGDWNWHAPERRDVTSGELQRRYLTGQGLAVELLGYRDAAEMRRLGRDEAGRRFGRWLGIEAATEQAVWVLGNTVIAFIEKADVPGGKEDELLIDDSWNVAGYAAPAEEDIARAALEGLGIQFDGDLRAATMRTCHRLVLSLYYETMLRRGDIPGWAKNRLVYDILNQQGSR